MWSKFPPDQKTVIGWAEWRGSVGLGWRREQHLRASGDALIRAGGAADCNLKESGLAIGLSTAQVRPDLLVEVLPGITRSHGNPDFAHRNPDLRADFEQLDADRRYLRLCQFGRLQSQPTQSAHQNVRHRRQVKSHLIGSDRFRAEAVGEQ